jgi:membrane protease YdiL (CAAX protease family)
VGVAFNPAAGALAHAAIIFIMLALYMLNEALHYRRVLPALMLVPLLRVLSLALPAPNLPQIYWYVLVGLPLLLAAVLAARRLGLTAGALGLARFDLWQFAIALSGLPLALLAYLMLRPAPLVSGAVGLALGAVVLAIFAGFTEEFIFRGVLLSATRAGYGRTAAIVASSLLFATVYVGTGSVAYLVLIGLAGLFFAYCADRTGSLWGVTAAHSLMVIGLLLVLPVLLGGAA